MPDRVERQIAIRRGFSRKPEVTFRNRVGLHFGCSSTDAMQGDSIDPDISERNRKILAARSFGTSCRACCHALITVMGHGDRNFQFDLFVRAGFEAEAQTARRLFNEGRVAEATAAIPLEMVDAIALVGPKARVLDHLDRWTSGIANYLIVRGRFDALRTIIESGRFE